MAKEATQRKDIVDFMQYMRAAAERARTQATSTESTSTSASDEALLVIGRFSRVTLADEVKRVAHRYMGQRPSAWRAMQAASAGGATVPSSTVRVKLYHRYLFSSVAHVRTSPSIARLVLAEACELAGRTQALQPLEQDPAHQRYSSAPRTTAWTKTNSYTSASAGVRPVVFQGRISAALEQYKVTVTSAGADGSAVDMVGQGVRHAHHRLHHCGQANGEQLHTRRITEAPRDCYDVAMGLDFALDMESWRDSSRQRRRVHNEWLLT